MATEEKNAEPVKGPELKSDHSWYSSLFTQLIVPMVSTRYIWLAIAEINPFNFLDKPLPKIEPNAKPYKEPSFGKYAKNNFPALGMGATFLAMVGAYSKNTLHDIKSIYAEAVGYELGKKTEDVTLKDILFTSQNSALKVTREAYLFRTFARSLTASTFFIPWHKFRSKPFQSTPPEYGINVNAGTGAIGAHIYGEGFLREPSFFDIEQKLVSSKINRNDVNPFIPIAPHEIQTLLTLQRKHLDKNHTPPLGASKEGQEQVKLAARITDLFNRTYDHIPDTGNESLTLGKLNYLIGFGLLDKYPESLAYVELANKSADMKEVKQVAQAIKNGSSAQETFLSHGIDMGNLANTASQPAITENIAEKFTQSIKPKSFMDFAAQKSEQNLNI